MSKDIVIQEGGTSKRFSGVDKIRTDQQGGGRADWIPEQDLIHLSVSRNGSYSARSAGAAGYSDVSVSVPQGGGPSYNIGREPSDDGWKCWAGTLEEYEAMGEYSLDTLYFIVTGTNYS